MDNFYLIILSNVILMSLVNIYFNSIIYRGQIFYTVQLFFLCFIKTFLSYFVCKGDRRTFQWVTFTFPEKILGLFIDNIRFSKAVTNSCVRCDYLRCGSKVFESKTFPNKTMISFVPKKPHCGGCAPPAQAGRQRWQCAQGTPLRNAGPRAARRAS